jgi:ninein
MWESAGIQNAYKLLSNLGFNNKSIELTDLVDVIDEKLQHAEDGKQNVPLLKASLALHKAQVNALHLAFRQVADENKKLYSDNKEANRRADLLAQEIDERHSSIENTTKSEVIKSN